MGDGQDGAGVKFFYMKNPLEVVSVGDVVEVKVISLDLERGRIGLSMRK